MKTIGLLGGTGWSSTIEYYALLNKEINDRLGGYHSAKILLKSIDYHDIMSSYGQDHMQTAAVLETELAGLIALQPDCLMICCNSLHKYYDMVKDQLNCSIPVMHAVDLVAEDVRSKSLNKVLLLATKFTMEDGFFAKKLEQQGIDVVLPHQAQQERMQNIHDLLMKNIVTEKSRAYFSDLIKAHQDLDAVILGCTEYPLVVDQQNSVLPIINPVHLQVAHAIDFALGE